MKKQISLKNSIIIISIVSMISCIAIYIYYQKTKLVSQETAEAGRNALESAKKLDPLIEDADIEQRVAREALNNLLNVK